MIKPVTIGVSGLNTDLNVNILPHRQQRLLANLEAADWLTPFYLAGGTALALQIGHRQSVDFDFFSETEFDSRLLIYEKRPNKPSALTESLELAGGVSHVASDFAGRFVGIY